MPLLGPALSGHHGGVSKVTVRLSADEIAVVCSCINEALDALSDEEFRQRVGADRQQARALLGRLDDRRTAARRAAAAVDPSDPDGAVSSRGPSPAVPTRAVSELG